MNGINEMYTDAPQETTENYIPAEDSDQGVDEVSRTPLPTYADVPDYPEDLVRQQVKPPVRFKPPVKIGRAHV